MPAGAGEEWHVHDSATQFFYVLEGTARMQAAERTVDLAARRALRSRPDLPTGSSTLPRQKLDSW
ncbi:cupin domain-containing protein [Microbacterium sp. WHRI 7836]|uniref:cupin domain-containing protein n=1 Tax=Microbacterium sp. WHRI 7836 TaxID=3162563 RepID=UPI0032EBCF6C